MTFESLHLPPELLKAVKRLGFTDPTPIQLHCIPEIKAGKDVVGQSLTGSGKTAAFGLPILEGIRPGAGVQALILTPTRELASQVKDTIMTFASFMHVHITAVYGGVAFPPQVDGLRRADIVVATPGRMLDHIHRGTVRLNNVRFAVLDEADKMFDMGFIDDIEEILGSLPKERQTLLFSATMPQEIQHMIRKHLRQPVIIKEQLHVDRSLLKQIYYDVRPQEKFSLLVHLIKNKTDGLALVFCGTRREVDIVTKNLKAQGFHVMAVHGGLSQNKRSHAVDSLKNENIQILVATDVAARGLHIDNISQVYNYDSAKNAEEYTHRIGRTARAGQSGEAITLLAERDYDNFRNVTSDRNLQIHKEQVPSFEKVLFVRQAQESRRPSSRPFQRRGFDDSHRSPRSSPHGRRPSHGAHASRSSGGSSRRSAPVGFDSPKDWR
ncbi:DEAD/DEAH box helicase [Candidatus Woesearchaeota archaeon]|nr:DEAD/DEAH box helicase [Candidatus Woesearchaeota archaeon]